ncbi:MAG: T9SS type A sorting domain-containing protein [Bacteroidia bacterium]|nr:T9SS type A sorting domain-containing protein [Bacteroidia bacterium]
MKHFNLCIENLSLTKTGNDFGIDDISLRQCVPEDVNALDNLMQGDACELADEPTALATQLSIHMLDFTGKRIGEKVALNWVSITEANLSHYEVQRSLDGSEFSSVGVVQAEGNTTRFTNYNFWDENLPASVPYLYYRLRIVDRKGLFRLSSIIRVELNKQEPDLLMFPNPLTAEEELQLKFNASEGEGRVSISDMMGREVLTWNTSISDGENHLSFPIRALYPGLYLVQLDLGYQRLIRRLLVR